jgi:DNA polymerase-3 subunit delta'
MIFATNPHRDLLERVLDDVPQALLLYGPDGAGKATLARAIAARLLGMAGHGPEHAHPDLQRVEPDAAMKSRPITVEAVRKACARLRLSASSGGARVLVVEEADAMTEAAANALLKTLEEPPAGAHLILTSARPNHLPATIRSRVRKQHVPAPDRDAALVILADALPDLSEDALARLLILADGNPGAALRLNGAGADGMAATIAALAADLAASGRIDRLKALAFAEGVKDEAWPVALRLVRRFVHLVGLAAAGTDISGRAGPCLNEAEAEAARACAAKAGARRAADLWRLVTEIADAAETAALDKSWNLYRLMLALEWAAR